MVILRVALHLVDCLKGHLALDEQSDIAQHDITIGNLRFAALGYILTPVAILNKFAVTEHVSYDAQPRWCDQSFVCKAQFDCPPQPHGIVPFREYMIPYMSKIQTLFPAPIGCAVKLN